MPEVMSYQITYAPELSLAMYRELAAHLQQVAGIAVTEIPQTSTTFAYLGSQLAGLAMRVEAPLGEGDGDRLRAILNHYGQWQVKPDLQI